ncbi:hypothetical protein niasHT_035778 [Heterodera trifolii]|uniref:Uncharacterized protein n=1 Tax=Heterodera trifolii TaxID=157864 RepID=A0ABD2I9B6_9BILA
MFWSSPHNFQNAHLFSQQSQSRHSWSRRASAKTILTSHLCQGPLSTRPSRRAGGTTAFLVRYREGADDETRARGQEKHPVDKSTLQLTVDGLNAKAPNTMWKSVAVQSGNEAWQPRCPAPSRVSITSHTSGVSPGTCHLYWVLAVLLILLLLRSASCVACCLVYQRGRKYPVAGGRRRFWEVARGGKDMYGPGSKNAGLATTSQPKTVESSSAGAQRARSDE